MVSNKSLITGYAGTLSPAKSYALITNLLNS
jgi:hypothetical protein